MTQSKFYLLKTKSAGYLVYTGVGEMVGLGNGSLEMGFGLETLYISNFLYISSM